MRNHERILATLALAGVLGASAATARAQEPGATADRTLDHGGVARTYRLHRPKGVPRERAVPLVVSLHGLGGSGRIQEAMTGLDAVADEKGFAVAYPDGRRRMWVLGDAGDVGDVGFLGALIDALVADGTADRRRVYVSGMSNGGYMANRLACEIPEKIAAIAPVSGTLPRPATRRAAAAGAAAGRAVPVVYFHGTDDAVVGYDGKDRFSGRQASLSAEELVAFWVERDGCAPEPSVEALPDRAGDGTSVERRSYAGGRGGAEVVFYRIVGGGHTWPGGSTVLDGLLGKTTRNLDASRAMWAFLSRFALPEGKEAREF